MGTWECMKLGEFPWHNTLGVFCWGRSLKIQSRKKEGGVHVLSELKKTMLLGPRLGSIFLISCYFVPSFILSRSRSEMLSIECWNVWKLVIFSSWQIFYVLFPNLCVPLPLPSPQQPPPNSLGGYLSIYDLYLKVLMFKQMLTFWMENAQVVEWVIMGRQ